MTKVDPSILKTFFPMNTKHNLYSRRPHLNNHNNIGSHNNRHHLHHNQWLIKEPASVSSRDSRSEASDSQDVTTANEETEDRLTSESCVEAETPDYELGDEEEDKTDSSIEEENFPQSDEDCGQESNSEFATRQLSYISLPSVLSSASGSVDYSNRLAPGRRRSFSASPAISCESVAVEEEESDPAEVPVDYDDNGDEREDEANNEYYTNSNVNGYYEEESGTTNHDDYYTNTNQEDEEIASSSNQEGYYTTNTNHEYENYYNDQVTITTHQDEYQTSTTNQEDEDEIPHMATTSNHEESYANSNQEYYDDKDDLGTTTNLEEYNFTSNQASNLEDEEVAEQTSTHSSKNHDVEGQSEDSNGKEYINLKFRVERDPYVDNMAKVQVTTTNPEDEEGKVDSVKKNQRDEDQGQSDDTNSTDKEYINLKFRVQRDPYVDDMAKVTVEVEPPSEVDEDLVNAPLPDEDVSDDEKGKPVEGVSESKEVVDENKEKKASESNIVVDSIQSKPSGEESLVEGEQDSGTGDLKILADKNNIGEDKSVAQEVKEGESTEGTGEVRDKETEHDENDHEDELPDAHAELLEKLDSVRVSSPTPSVTSKMSKVSKGSLRSLAIFSKKAPTEADTQSITSIPEKAPGSATSKKSKGSLRSLAIFSKKAPGETPVDETLEELDTMSITSIPEKAPGSATSKSSKKSKGSLRSLAIFSKKAPGESPVDETLEELDTMSITSIPEKAPGSATSKVSKKSKGSLRSLAIFSKKKPGETLVDETIEEFDAQSIASIPSTPGSVTSKKSKGSLRSMFSKKVPGETTVEADRQSISSVSKKAPGSATSKKSKGSLRSLAIFSKKAPMEVDNQPVEEEDNEGDDDMIAIVEDDDDEGMEKGDSAGKDEVATKISESANGEPVPEGEKLNAEGSIKEIISADEPQKSALVGPSIPVPIAIPSLVSNEPIKPSEPVAGPSKPFGTEHPVPAMQKPTITTPTKSIAATPQKSKFTPKSIASSLKSLISIASPKKPFGSTPKSITSSLKSLFSPSKPFLSKTPKSITSSLKSLFSSPAKPILPKPPVGTVEQSGAGNISDTGSLKSKNKIVTFASTARSMLTFGRLKFGRNLPTKTQVVPENTSNVNPGRLWDTALRKVAESSKDPTKTGADSIANVGENVPRAKTMQQAAILKMKQAVRSKPSITAIATIAGRRFKTQVARKKNQNAGLQAPDQPQPTSDAAKSLEYLMPDVTDLLDDSSGGSKRSISKLGKAAIMSRRLSGISQANLLKPPAHGSQVDIKADVHAEQVINEEDGLDKSSTGQGEKQGDHTPEEYLSVFREGSFEHAEDDDDYDKGNTKQVQQKFMTQDSIENVEKAKDELLEEWKKTEKRSDPEMDEINDNFSNILGDMINELDMPLVPPPLTRLQRMVLREEEKAEQRSKLKAEQKEQRKMVRRKKRRKMLHGSDTDSPDSPFYFEPDLPGKEKSGKSSSKDSSVKQSPESNKSSGGLSYEEIQRSEKVHDVVSVAAVAKFVKRQSSFSVIPVPVVPVKPLEPVEDQVSIQSSPKKDDEDISPKNRRKWKNPLEIASTLSQYLGLVKIENIENNLSEIIPLITRLIGMSRKTKTELELPTLIASLSAAKVLCERILQMRAENIGVRALKNVDLSFLIRVLCKISADDKAKAQPEASFTLARLVRAAGPELITRPIYFLLVMENEGRGKSKGSQGAKTKAAALDTLTYTLLSFSKDEFDDLEEIARWVGILVFHPQRRVRQSALECCAVIGNLLGGDTERSIMIFRRALTQEQEHHYSRSSDEGQGPKNTLASSQAVLGKGIFDVTAINAIAARIRRRKQLPLPSSNGLIEYAVKVPVGEELIRILCKMHEKEAEEFEFSTSSDESYISDMGKLSFVGSKAKSESEESIRMSDLEKSAAEAKANNFQPKKRNYSDDEDDGRPIKKDVAYILCGRGKVNKQDEVLVEENLQEVNDMVFAERLKIFMKEIRPRKKKKRKKNKQSKQKMKVAQVQENGMDSFGCDTDSEVYF